MKKQFLSVQQGLLKVLMGQTVDIVNTGNSVIHVSDETAYDAAKELETNVSTIVKDTLFGLHPGQSKRLTFGNHVVDFNGSVTASAVKFVITSPPAKKAVEPAKKPVETKPDEQQQGKPDEQQQGKPDEQQQQQQ